MKKRSYQIVDNEDVEEPISLLEQKHYSRIDADYVADDSDLGSLLTAARVLLEQQLNIGLVRREVKLQWSGRTMELPLSPTGEVSSVTLNDVVLTGDQYHVDKRQAKTISIAGVSASSGLSFFYGTDGSIEISSSTSLCSNSDYEAIYQTGYEVLPKNLKQAIMAQCDFMFKQRGMPDNDQICSTAIRLAKGYSRNLAL